MIIVVTVQQFNLKERNIIIIIIPDLHIYRQWN